MMKKEKTGFLEQKIFSNLSRAEQYTGAEVSEKDQEIIHELAEQLRDKKEEK